MCVCVCTGCACVCVCVSAINWATKVNTGATWPTGYATTKYATNSITNCACQRARAFPLFHTHTHTCYILELYCLHISGLPKLGACCVLSTSRPPLRRLSALPPHALFYVFLCMAVYVCLCFFIACCQAQQHIGLPLKNIRSHFSDSFHKIVQNVFLYFYFSFFLGQLPFYIFSMFCCLHLGFLGRGIYISWRISFNTLRLRPQNCVSIGTAVNLKACVDKKIKWNYPFNLFAVGSVISI